MSNNMHNGVKLKEANYDPETGISKVTIITSRFGEFTGYAKVCESDKGRESRFIGCEYAEAKAMIKYKKAQLKEKKSELHAIEKLKNSLNSSKYFNSPYAVTRIDLEINTLRNEITNLKESIKFIYAEMEKRIALRDDVLSTLERWSKISN